MLAVTVILAWVVTGPLFRFSDTWQLVINTATTVITFLMVFLIQATQNRDAEAVQVKLDELLRATSGAHNALMDLEQLEERELDAILAGYRRLGEISTLACLRLHESRPAEVSVHFASATRTARMEVIGPQTVPAPSMIRKPDSCVLYIARPSARLYE
jgi:low affinity Fe/Cu permease